MIYSRQFQGGGVSRPAGGGDVATGALTANTLTTVTHSFGLTDYQIEVRDADNNVEVKTLKKSTTDPTNAVIIEVGVDLPNGLTISIIGY